MPSRALVHQHHTPLDLQVYQPVNEYPGRRSRLGRLLIVMLFPLDSRRPQLVHAHQLELLFHRAHAFPLAACFACSPVSYLPTSRCPCHTLYSSRPPCRVRLIIQSPLAIASALSRRHFTATSSMPPPRTMPTAPTSVASARSRFAAHPTYLPRPLRLSGGTASPCRWRGLCSCGPPARVIVVAAGGRALWCLVGHASSSMVT